MMRTTLAFIILSALAVTALEVKAAPKSVKAVGPYSDVDVKGMPAAKDGDDLGTGDENVAKTARPVPPKTGAPAPVTFTARLSESSPTGMSDVVWRIFEGRPNRDGGYRLLNTLRDSRPTVELNPGEYLVNVAYGRANITKKIGVWPEKAMTEEFVLLGGGLRLSATVAKAPISTEHLLKFELFSESQDQFGNRKKVPGEIRPGVVLRLNSGVYHVTSTYGDGNSVVSTDVVVEPGKITEAAIDHDAAKVTLKLVQRTGGEAVADANWTVFAATGELVKESAGAFPTHILASGSYKAVAKLGDKQHSQTFSLTPGSSSVVEVLMK